MDLLDNSIALISAALPRATRISDRDVTTDHVTFNFEWSFRPLTFWMKLFGIPFFVNKRRPSSVVGDQDQSHQASTISNNENNNNNHGTSINEENSKWSLFNRWRDCLMLIPLTMTFYLLNVGCNIYNVIVELTAANGTSVKVWSEFIDSANFYYLTICTHTGLLATCAFGWRGLVRSLHRMEQRKLFDDDDYRRFRRIFNTGFFVIFLVIIFSYNNLRYCAYKIADSN